MAAVVLRNDRRASTALKVGGLAGVVLGGVGGLLALLLQAAAGRVLIAITLATLAAPLWVFLALRIDRYEPEPRKVLALVFIWGAFAATFIAGILNDIGGAIVGSGFGTSIGEIYGSTISAPLVEETAKGFALFAVYRWRRSEFNGVIDGITYACMVGLGFAMVENYSYFARFPDTATIFVRGVLSPYSHPLFTSMTGIGFGIASLTTDREKKVRAVLIGLAGAMIAHGIWNGVFSTSDHFFAWYFLAAMPAFIAMLVAISFLRRAEGRAVAKFLRPEVEGGILSEEDIRSLGSLTERRRARGVAKNRGPDALRAEKAFQQTATELAFARRSAGGDGLPEEDERAYRVALEALRKTAREPGPASAAKQSAPPPAARSGDGAPATSPSAAGWYPDPWNGRKLRFWNGHEYTWHTAPLPRPTVAGGRSG